MMQIKVIAFPLVLLVPPEVLFTEFEASLIARSDLRNTTPTTTMTLLVRIAYPSSHFRLELRSCLFV